MAPLLNRIRPARDVVGKQPRHVHGLEFAQAAAEDDWPAREASTQEKTSRYGRQDSQTSWVGRTYSFPFTPADDRARGRRQGRILCHRCHSRARQQTAAGAPGEVDQTELHRRGDRQNTLDVDPFRASGPMSHRSGEPLDGSLTHRHSEGTSHLRREHACLSCKCILLTVRFGSEAVILSRDSWVAGIDRKPLPRRVAVYRTPDSECRNY